MIVSNIRYTNLDKIYNKLCIGTDEIAIPFGCNFYKLLEHVYIVFDLTHVSMMEAYFLKEYYGAILNVKVSTTLDRDDEVYLNIEDYYRPMVNLLMNNNKTLSNEDILSTLPTEASVLSGTATLTGASICNLISVLPDEFFKEFCKKYNSYENEMSEEPGWVYNMKMFLMDKFIETYDDIVNKKLRSTDIMSDPTLHFNYHNYVSNINEVALSDIIYNGDRIGLLGDDAKTFTENYENAKCNWAKKNYLDNTDVFIVVRSTLYTFLKIYIFELCNHCIIDTSDIKILAYTSEYKNINKDPLIETRYHNRMKDLLAYRTDGIEKENFGYIMERVPMNVPITFTLKIDMGTPYRTGNLDTLTEDEKMIFENITKIFNVVRNMFK